MSTLILRSYLLRRDAHLARLICLLIRLLLLMNLMMTRRCQARTARAARWARLRGALTAASPGSI